MTAAEKTFIKEYLYWKELRFEDREPFVICSIAETDSTDNVEGLGEPPYLVCTDGLNRRWTLSYPQAVDLVLQGAYEATFHEDGEEKSYLVTLKPTER